MFIPHVDQGRNTSVILDAGSPLVAAYASTLERVELADVPMLELIHTLMPDAPSVPASAVDELHQATQQMKAVFRDADRNLVVRIEDQLWLLWPVLRPVDGVGQPRAVRARSGRAFVQGDTGRLVPLPAVSRYRADGVNWGDRGTTGTINFYLALVYAVNGEVPPIPPPAFNDEPRSMFGWMRRQQGPEVTWEWPAVMQLVAEDKPLRDAAAKV